MTKYRRGRRSARQQGEDIGDAIGEFIALMVEGVRDAIKWVWRKARR